MSGAAAAECLACVGRVRVAGTAVMTGGEAASPPTTGAPTSPPPPSPPAPSVCLSGGVGRSWRATLGSPAWWACRPRCPPAYTPATWRPRPAAPRPMTPPPAPLAPCPRGSVRGPTPPNAPALHPPPGVPHHAAAPPANPAAAPPASPPTSRPDVADTALWNPPQPPRGHPRARRSPQGVRLSGGHLVHEGAKQGRVWPAPTVWVAYRCPAPTRDPPPGPGGRQQRSAQYVTDTLCFPSVGVRYCCGP